MQPARPHTQNAASASPRPHQAHPPHLPHFRCRCRCRYDGMPAWGCQVSSAPRCCCKVISRRFQYDSQNQSVEGSDQWVSRLGPIGLRVGTNGFEVRVSIALTWRCFVLWSTRKPTAFFARMAEPAASCRSPQPPPYSCRSPQPPPYSCISIACTSALPSAPPSKLRGPVALSPPPSPPRA